VRRSFDGTVKGRDEAADLEEGIESGELRPVFIMSVRVRVSSIGLGEEGSSIGYYYLLLSYY
jgi:hypothetical protein